MIRITLENLLPVIKNAAKCLTLPNGCLKHSDWNNNGTFTRGIVAIGNTAEKIFSTGFNCIISRSALVEKILRQLGLKL